MLPVVPLRSMFSTEIFLPRGHGYLWTPWLLVGELASNALLALALLIIGVRLVRRAQAAAPAGMARATAWVGLLAFVLAATHVLDVLCTWTPIYGIDVVVRSLAALVALATAMFV
jgi:hypothetical protein